LHGSSFSPKKNQSSNIIVNTETRRIPGEGEDAVEDLEQRMSPADRSMLQLPWKKGTHSLRYLLGFYNMRHQLNERHMS